MVMKGRPTRMRKEGRNWAMFAAKSSPMSNSTRAACSLPYQLGNQINRNSEPPRFHHSPGGIGVVWYNQCLTLPETITAVLVDGWDSLGGGLSLFNALQCRLYIWEWERGWSSCLWSTSSLPKTSRLSQLIGTNRLKVLGTWNKIYYYHDQCHYHIQHLNHLIQDSSVDDNGMQSAGSHPGDH